MFRMKIGFIPEGCLKIAQRFSVGLDHPMRSSPEGTAEKVDRPFQPSLRDWRFSFPRLPNAKALGYFQTSLRDDHEATQLPFRKLLIAASKIKERKAPGAGRWGIPTGFRPKAQGWPVRGPTLGGAAPNRPNPEGVASGPRQGRNPVGVEADRRARTQGRRGRQPWALGRNPFGICIGPCSWRCHTFALGRGASGCALLIDFLLILKAALTHPSCFGFRRSLRPQSGITGL